MSGRAGKALPQQSEINNRQSSFIPSNVENRSLPLWPLAQLEGKVAGYNMAGKKTDYEGGTSMSSLKYFGVPITSIGIANPKEDNAYELSVFGHPNRYGPYSPPCDV